MINILKQYEYGQQGKRGNQMIIDHLGKVAPIDLIEQRKW